MNKASMVEDLAGRVNISKAEAERIIGGIFNGIIDEVKAGRTVSIAGFGIFQAKERAAREARNPRTGETIHVPATRVPKFKPAKAFKDAVKGM